MTVFLGLQTVGGRLQGGQSARFAAEGQALRHPGGLQQSHRPPGKALGRGYGPGRRQLKDQIGAAAQRKRRAGPFIRKGSLAPLNPVSAHNTDYSTISAIFRSSYVNMIGMSRMKWIVFRHNTQKFHNAPRLDSFFAFFDKYCCSFF
ncbi:hypothetical protein SDC9_157289 [bioreactor metagenome]|uniref:Uncharacterized protein n=1 Tax=bioreactor metagenome TaxID=1076179 RepID=A0A645F8P3_9ZZZZ